MHRRAHVLLSYSCQSSEARIVVDGTVISLTPSAGSPQASTQLFPCPSQAAHLHDAASVSRQRQPWNQTVPGRQYGPGSFDSASSGNLEIATIFTKNFVLKSMLPQAVVTSGAKTTTGEALFLLSPPSSS